MTCANGCGRATICDEQFCRECTAGSVPLVHPTLLPTDYLQACALELAGRGANGNGERMHQIVEDAWNLARGKLSTRSTKPCTSEGGR